MPRTDLVATWCRETPPIALASLAAELPVILYEAFAATGQIERALRLAERHPDPGGRAALLARIAGAAPDNRGCEQAAGLAVQAARDAGGEAVWAFVRMPFGHVLPLDREMDRIAQAVERAGRPEEADALLAVLAARRISAGQAEGSAVLERAQSRYTRHLQQGGHQPGTFFRERDALGLGALSLAFARCGEPRAARRWFSLSLEALGQVLTGVHEETAIMLVAAVAQGDAWDRLPKLEAALSDQGRPAWVALVEHLVLLGQPDRAQAAIAGEGILEIERAIADQRAVRTIRRIDPTRAWEPMGRDWTDDALEADLEAGLVSSEELGRFLAERAFTSAAASESDDLEASLRRELRRFGAVIDETRKALSGPRPVRADALDEAWLEKLTEALPAERRTGEVGRLPVRLRRDLARALEHLASAPDHRTALTWLARLESRLPSELWTALQEWPQIASGHAGALAAAGRLEEALAADRRTVLPASGAARLASRLLSAGRSADAREVLTRAFDRDRDLRAQAALAPALAALADFSKAACAAMQNALEEAEQKIVAT